MTNHRGAGKAISNHAGNNMQEATENKVHDVLAARDEKHARFKERHHVLQQPNNAVEKHVLVEKEPLEKAHGKAKLKSMRAQNDKLKQKVSPSCRAVSCS